MTHPPVPNPRGRAPSVLNERVIEALGVMCWITIAAWLYTPLKPRAYEVADFPDFLPILRASTSALDAIADLTRYYVPHGRLNVAAFTILTAKWSLFGEQMALWHMARFFEMCLIAWLIYLLARQLGAGKLGGWAATTFFLASPAAALSWMRMSIAEPPGTVLIVLLCLLLLRTPPERASPLRLGVLALIVMTIGFLKEVLLAAVPVVTLALLALERRGRLDLQIFRDARLWAIVAGGALAALPIAIVALTASPEGYSSLFDAVPVSAANFFMPLLAALMPFAPTSFPFGIIDLLAIAVLFGGLVLAWGAAFSDKPRSTTLALLSLGLGLPLAGACVYTLWPSYRLFYALPFQIGGAVMVSLAVTWMLQGPRIARVSTLAALMVIAAPMLTFAHSFVSLTDASRRFTKDAALWIGQLPSSSSVALAVCGLPPDHFANYGGVLRRYALSLNLTPPEVLDVPCGPASDGPGSVAPSWRVVLSDGSEPELGGAIRSVYTYPTFDLRAMRVHQHSIVMSARPPARP